MWEIASILGIRKKKKPLLLGGRKTWIFYQNLCKIRRNGLDMLCFHLRKAWVIHLPLKMFSDCDHFPFLTFQVIDEIALKERLGLKVKVCLLNSQSPLGFIPKFPTLSKKERCMASQICIFWSYFSLKPFRAIFIELTLVKILKIKNVPDRKEIYVKVPYTTIIVVDLLVCCGSWTFLIILISKKTFYHLKLIVLYVSYISIFKHC